MGDMHREVSIPLDDGFLRRECPLCVREFKVALLPEEIEDLPEKIRRSFLVTEDPKGERNAAEDDDKETHFCPYCGQEAPEGQWWTQEQVEYIGTIEENWLADVLNEKLIEPMKRMSRRSRGGLISFEFKGRAIEHKEEWIAPETDDMTVVHLPCCDRSIKILDDWSGIVHCFFCGFPHTCSGSAGSRAGRST